MDVKNQGNKFNWSNRKFGNLIQRRLDRFLVLKEAFPFFWDVLIAFLLKIGFVRSLLIFYVYKERRFFKTPFWFESILLLNYEVGTIIQN